MSTDRTIWMYLLGIVGGLGVHGILLWPLLWREALSTELVIFEARLSRCAAELPEESAALARLRRFISKLREVSGSLAYSRLVLAWILLPAAARGRATCRQQWERLEDSALRQEGLEILDAVENAVARRLLWGSPLLWAMSAALWVRNFLRAPGGPHRGPAAFVPGLELLEGTLGDEAQQV